MWSESYIVVALLYKYGVEVFHSVWSLVGARDCRVLGRLCCLLYAVGPPDPQMRNSNWTGHFIEGLERPQLLAWEGGVVPEPDPHRYQEMAVCVCTPRRTKLVEFLESIQISEITVEASSPKGGLLLICQFPEFKVVSSVQI